MADVRTAEGRDAIRDAPLHPSGETWCTKLLREACDALDAAQARIAQLEYSKDAERELSDLLKAQIAELERERDEAADHLLERARLYMDDSGEPRPSRRKLLGLAGHLVRFARGGREGSRKDQ